MRTRQKTYLMIAVVIAVGLLAALPFFRERPKPLAVRTERLEEGLSWPRAVPLRVSQIATESPAHAAAILSREAAEQEPLPSSLRSSPRIEGEPVPQLLAPPTMLNRFPSSAHPFEPVVTMRPNSGMILDRENGGLPPSRSTLLRVDRVDDDATDQAPTRTHRIRDGDTLELLAEHYLGSAGRYLEIFAANSDRLADPDLLPIGRELVIPDRGLQAPSDERPSRRLVPVHIGP